jgi:hypothetical protein
VSVAAWEGECAEEFSAPEKIFPQRLRRRGARPCVPVLYRWRPSQSVRASAGLYPTRQSRTKLRGQSDTLARRSEIRREPRLIELSQGRLSQETRRPTPKASAFPRSSAILIRWRGWGYSCWRRYPDPLTSLAAGPGPPSSSKRAQNGTTPGFGRACPLRTLPARRENNASTILHCAPASSPSGHGCRSPSWSGFYFPWSATREED